MELDPKALEAARKAHAAVMQRGAGVEYDDAALEDAVRAYLEAAEAKLAGGEAVKPLEWQPTKTLNRNDYHGSKPHVVEYASAGEFRYTLSANYQVGASWDARRGTTTPINGGTCVSLDEAKSAAQADYERRILSALTHPVPTHEDGSGEARLHWRLHPVAECEVADPDYRIDLFDCELFCGDESLGTHDGLEHAKAEAERHFALRGGAA